ncbi:MULTISPECIES: hypothetical protein [unclassified Imperialibacter]|uniref:hypothetical protein n=1 Tax=unclassified Imperialibacter TaxID=2629706 RepID=UPI00125842E1|nr:MULTISPECIES: hypothetical protein [unclassified Imperialibacter]CAD5248233.1 exported hypothetical protein [Imperialibacter sp. 75]CAD5248361.1 exported hypothetical protein [Imperialibacter sp. 89]VVS97605.1 exported hypothetical protein [Imperialibacter sp. EC-SDR9]
MKSAILLSVLLISSQLSFGQNMAAEAVQPDALPVAPHTSDTAAREDNQSTNTIAYSPTSTPDKATAEETVTLSRQGKRRAIQTQERYAIAHPKTSKKKNRKKKKQGAIR